MAADAYEAIITLEIERAEDGSWVATSEDVPGLVARGRTIQETVEIAQDVARKIAETLIEEGLDLPPALKGAVPPRFRIQVPVGVS